MEALKIKNIVKTYNDGTHALKGVNLNIKKGDFFGLLGPNGAGKTTIIGILTDLVTKTSGTVKIFDHDIDKDFNTAKTFIGVVPQEMNFNIFEKVQDIVIQQAGYYGIPRKIAKKRAQTYLKQLGLWEKRNTISQNLSGGMKRRLMIARALIHKPQILVLDEPTAGVDVGLRRSMWDFLVDINKKGTTIILTTHYLEEAEQLCKNIAIINNGQIVENASKKTILNKLTKEIFVLDLAQTYKIKETKKIKQIDETTLEIHREKDDNLNTIFTYLQKHNIKVKSMRNKSNRLEKLFLDYVEDNNEPHK